MSLIGSAITHPYSLTETIRVSTIFFSKSGFTGGLKESEAAGEVKLITLPDLYAG